MKDAFHWGIEYDGAAPPLPAMADLSEFFSHRGAYFVWVDPVIAGRPTVRPPWMYAGVLRVVGPDRTSKEVGLSCDLYRSSRSWVTRTRDEFKKKRGPEALRSLQLPQGNYRYYLRLAAPPDGDKLRLEPYAWLEKKRSWERRNLFDVEIKQTIYKDPVGEEPIDGKPYQGPIVSNLLGTPIARMGLHWLTERVRYARVRVYDIRGHNRGKKLKVEQWKEEWRTRMSNTQWKIEIKEQHVLSALSEEPKGGEWTRRTLRRRYRNLTGKKSRKGRGRDRSHLNNSVEPESTPAVVFDEKLVPWDYTFLVVKNLVRGDSANPRGLMFSTGTREAAAIAVERPADNIEGTPIDHPEWLTRIALHELGHMQGLHHNSEPGVMRRHRHAVNTAQGTPIPDITDADHEHHENDVLRLQHMPDMWVRPRGVPFAHRYKETAADVLDLIPRTKKLSLELHISPNPATSNQSVGDLKLTFILKNMSQEGIVCPNRRHIRPRYRRLGLLLGTPAGEEIEIMPVCYPRGLGSVANTVLLEGEQVELVVDWPKRPRRRRFRNFKFDQLGEYSLKAHLMWMVDDEKDQNKLSGDEHGNVHGHVHYRVEAENSFEVEGKPDIKTSGQDDQEGQETPAGNSSSGAATRETQ